MDLFQRSELVQQDFFEESHLPYKCLPPHPELADSLLFQDSFLFFAQHDPIPRQNIPSPMPDLSSTPSSRDLPSADDTNQLQQFLGNRPTLSDDDLLFELEFVGPREDVKQEVIPCVSEISARELESVISFLVQNATLNVEQTSAAVSGQFPSLKDHPMVKALVDKFGHLKKTKEELIKYCMRKAFKFVLELPKNRHMLGSEQKERLSFSKGKSRFLKKVSEEKSMNSKFLSQVFREGDFGKDYLLFLEGFEDIIAEDNDKKIRYLAELLNCSKEGKESNAEMVRRLPWTRPILEKVKKIASELLKFSPTPK